MTLHIFNPEHDIALASHLANFTAPHAGRQLRADLGFLPALWAKDGDVVWVEHEESAQKAYDRLSKRVVCALQTPCLQGGNIMFASSKCHTFNIPITRIEPWGWDLALRAALRRKGIADSLLPSDEYLELVRQLSHRRTAAQLLPKLRQEGTVGESFECSEAREVEELLQRYGQVVMKAPWSSSGRGLRFLSSDRTPFASQAGWFRNVVASQGSVMVEPFYHKVKDFGMEFEATDDGIRYLGLSLFDTANGAYTGNVLATEQTKREMMGRYVPLSLLDDVRDAVISMLDLRAYRGPFGIDMMVVNAPSSTSQASGSESQGLGSTSQGSGSESQASGLLHPCVEINLRRTMGHVALAISPQKDDIVKVMRIICSKKQGERKISLQ